MNVGVDIGGSKTLVVTGDDHYKIASSQKIPTPPSSDQAITEIIHLIERLASKQPVDSIAVAAPGPVDAKTGIISATNLGWKSVGIGEALTNHFAVPVVVENDAAAAALSEATIGAGRGYHNVLYITISTGVNAFLVQEGRVYHGAHGSEAGHMVIDPQGPECGCGGKGHWEALICGPAIKRRFGVFGWEIKDAEIWNAYAKDVAIGLHNLLTTESPDIVVMGGGVNVHFRKFEVFLKRHLLALHPLYPIPPIVPAKNMETAVAYGTLVLADRLVSEKPVATQL
jgi:predicted NBD/HSP70 family sugar kinase